MKKGQKKFNIAIVFAVLLLSLSSAACKKSSDATPATPATSMSASNTNAVTIQNNAFNSDAITVAVNTTVIWTNKDGFAHTVTSNSGFFDSNQIAAGGTYMHQFATAGTFFYHCSNHSLMTGTVVVK